MNRTLPPARRPSMQPDQPQIGIDRTVWSNAWMLAAVIVAVHGTAAAAQDNATATSKDAASVDDASEVTLDSTSTKRVVLFGGEDDFSRWRGNRDYWSVQDDVIVGVNPADKPLPRHTYLVYRGDGDADATFSNFTLVAQFKIEGEGGNSGIQYRGRQADNDDPNMIQGYQADIDFNNKYAGILYEQDGRGILATRGQSVTIDAGGKKTKQSFATAESLRSSIHPGQWNQYRIVADGETLEHYINETLTVRVTDRQTERRSDSGVIALQLHRGPPMTVRFKNISVTKR